MEQIQIDVPVGFSSPISWFLYLLLPFEIFWFVNDVSNPMGLPHDTSALAPTRISIYFLCVCVCVRVFLMKQMNHYNWKI